MEEKLYEFHQFNLFFREFVNFPGQNQWQRRNRFMFLINTTE